MTVSFVVPLVPSVPPTRGVSLFYYPRPPFPAGLFQLPFPRPPPPPPPPPPLRQWEPLRPAIAVTRSNPLMITAGDPTLSDLGHWNASGGGVEVVERPPRKTAGKPLCRPCYRACADGRDDEGENCIAAAPFYATYVCIALYLVQRQLNRQEMPPGKDVGRLWPTPVTIEVELLAKIVS